MGVLADDGCGGVCEPAFWIGDMLPLELPFELRCNVKLVCCVLGEMGDLGATVRTLSGESGVRLCSSLSILKVVRKWHSIIHDEQFLK